MLKTRDNGVVAYVPTGFIDQRKLDAAVRRVQRSLARSVVRIRYDLDEDWAGRPSIFFRVLLTDQASKPENLREVGQRVRQRIIDEANTDRWGVLAYFNLRSESEQSQLKDPAWA